MEMEGCSFLYEIEEEEREVVESSRGRAFARYGARTLMLALYKINKTNFA